MNTKWQYLFLFLFLCFLPCQVLSAQQSLDADLNQLEQIIIDAQKNSEKQALLIESLQRSLEASEQKLETTENSLMNLESSLNQMSLDYQKLYKSYEESEKRSKKYKSITITVAITVPIVGIVGYLIGRYK